VGKADMVANAEGEGSPGARGFPGRLLDCSSFRRERARRQPHSGGSAGRNDSPARPSGRSPLEERLRRTPPCDLISKVRGYVAPAQPVDLPISEAVAVALQCCYHLALPWRP
jgi:hypothetical protein